MSPEVSERRKVQRYAIESEATVELPNESEPVSATTVNLSGSGVLLRFSRPVKIAVGDDAICRLKVRFGSGEPIPYWGVGRVVRLNGPIAGIEFNAGMLNPLEPQDEPSSLLLNE